MLDEGDIGPGRDVRPRAGWDNQQFALEQRRFAMTRFALSAVALIVAAGMPVRGDDLDETKRLKERIELLAGKLKNAEKEIELLKKELELAKKGGPAKPRADDGFGVGTKLVGTATWSWVAGGKRVVLGNDVEFEVTKRSGTEFAAEIWLENRKSGFEVEGTIDIDGYVKLKSTKSLTDQNVNMVGVHTGTGRLTKGVLTGKTKKKGDASYKGEWKLKANKD